jgi:hypothetical protein
VILAGGAVFSHLDFSFTTDRPDGTAVPLASGTPGGGGPDLRNQLSILKRFIEGFDFVRMKPDSSVIKSIRDAGKPNANLTARALVEAGRAYAVYINGGTRVDVVIELPAGAYTAEWLDTKTGKVARSERFSHDRGNKSLGSPDYSEDIALAVKRIDSK